jgi:hypothetical protein
VRLAEHPLLAGVNLGVVGWGPIRDHPDHNDPSNNNSPSYLYSAPGYSRAVLSAGVRRSLRAQTDAFPGKGVYIGFWNVDDKNGSLPKKLWEDLQADIFAEFDDVTRPKIGFWMENLSHSFDGATDVYKPDPATGGIALAAARGHVFAGLQALDSWAAPFTGNPGATAGGSPVAAMRWAMGAYDARYFELYTSDLDAGTWDADFAAFHDGELWSQPLPPEKVPPPAPRGVRWR